jgi:glutathione S-transferase
MAPTIVLGYWDCRGRAEYIRMLLEFAGQEFEDRRYELTGTPTRTWLGEDKVSMEKDLAFPNLPYYLETREDGTELKITQSVTILRYLGRKFGLSGVTGSTDQEKTDQQATVELYEQQIIDLGNNIIGYGYDSSMIATRLPNYPEACKPLLKAWVRNLEGKQWLMGSELCYADFLLYEVLDWHRLMKADIYDSDDLRDLAKYLERFEEIPSVKKYLTSDRYQNWPITSPYAKNFGYHKKPQE